MVPPIEVPVLSVTPGFMQMKGDHELGSQGSATGPFSRDLSLQGAPSCGTECEATAGVCNWKRSELFKLNTHSISI